jgi:hypothetical protein
MLGVTRNKDNFPQDNLLYKFCQQLAIAVQSERYSIHILVIELIPRPDTMTMHICGEKLDVPRNNNAPKVRKDPTNNT